MLTIQIGFSQPRNPLSAMDPKTLALCPDSPNCVSSQAAEARHFIEPLGFSGVGPQAFKILKEIISDLPNTRITESTDTYLHAEFRTRWLKFTDDVDAIVDEERKIIEIRSASRIGYWDLGTNRRRVELIRGLLAKQKK